MSAKIENFDQLREEIRRLESKRDELKASLSGDVEEIKTALHPAHLLADFISGLAGIKIHKELFTQEGFIEELLSILKQIVIRSGTAFFASKVYGNVFKFFFRLFRRKKNKDE